MIIVENDPERAVWLDFDRAQTYHADSLSQRQKGLIEMEELNVCQFAEKLVSNSCGWLDKLMGILGYWTLIFYAVAGT